MILSTEVTHDAEDIADLLPVSGLTGLSESDTVWHEVDTFLYRFLRYHVEGLGELNALKVYSPTGTLPRTVRLAEPLLPGFSGTQI